jgi:hypothetical protein
MLSVNLLNVVMPNAANNPFTLNVIMLNVVLMSVVAPFRHLIHNVEILWG